MEKEIREKIDFLLEKCLENNNISNDFKTSDLVKKVKNLKNYKSDWLKLKEEKNNYRELLEELSEENLKNEFSKEISRIEEEEKSLFHLIEEILITKQDSDFKDNCIIEIRSGAGGNESKLFAREIFQMYLKYSEKKHWKIETMNSAVDSLGGISFISFLVKGKEAFKFLKNESGVHRVQRIPKTESKDKLQTSTITVVVFPELNEIDIDIRNEDIRVDTYRSSGAGGQHVNTTDSAVRVTHIKTGLSTTSQDGRSQIENKKYALSALKSILYRKYEKDREDEVGSIRKGAIGSSERHEKIRTYNFPQRRITDHRIGFQVNKFEKFFINGEIEELCKALVDSEKNINIDTKLKRIEYFIKRLKKLEK